MKNAVMALAVAGMIASGGAALAGDKAPEPNTWQYSLALETGTLPAVHSKVDTAKNRTAGEPVPVTEIGGLRYRVGLDTGP